MPAGRRLFDVTRNGCSCDFYASSTGFDEATARRRYALKGWTPGKIEEAIRRRAARTGGSPEHTAFRDAVADAVRQAGSVSLLAHWYTLAYDSEVVASKAAFRLSLAEYLAAEGLFPEDTVVTVFRV